MSASRDVRDLARSASTVAAIAPPRRRWFTRLVLPLLVLLLAVGLLVYAAWDELRGATEVRAVSVLVKEVVGPTPGTVTVRAPGWLEPDPHPHYVAALTSGVVEELLVLEGDRVEAGQIVARLVADDAELAVARARATVAARRGGVAVAQAELDASRQSLEALIGPTAALDDARARLAARRAERVQLTAEVRAAEARLAATADELQRKRALVESEAVARGEVERLRLRRDAERAALEAARAKLPVLDANTAAAAAALRAAERNLELLIDERRAVAQAEARLERARAELRVAEADLGTAELRLERTAVCTLHDGVVLERLAAPGSTMRVTANDESAHVLHLYDPQRLQVRVDVPLVDAARVALGQDAEVVVDALPDRVFTGRVSRFNHLADIAKNTVEVKVAVDAPDAVLKPDMLARVRFVAAPDTPADGEASRTSLWIPRRAFVGGGAPAAGGVARLWLVDELVGDRGVAASREVTLGSGVVDDHVEIAVGLSPGDRVIVDAPPGLEADTPVRIITAGREGD